MLYLIKIDDIPNCENTYHIFETCTESLIISEKAVAIELIGKHKMEAKNISIHEGQIVIKQWPHEIKRSSDAANTLKSDYVILVNIDEQRFKLVNILGDVLYKDSERLKDSIKQGRVTNCEFTKRKHEYKSVDTYIIQNDPKFEKHIAEKYETFRAKILALGIDISFDYLIENNEVKLTGYTGTSRIIILPNFITVIRRRAFYGKGIKEIKLNSGLKLIGREAFVTNKISSIVIPESVSFIGSNAFCKNNDLLNMNGYIDKNRVTLLNNKAFISNDRQ